MSVGGGGGELILHKAKYIIIFKTNVLTHYYYLVDIEKPGILKTEIFFVRFELTIFFSIVVIS